MGNTASTNTADISILAEVLSPIRFREITLTLREVKLKYGAQHSLLTVNEFEDSLSNLFASRSSWLFNLFGGSTASVDEVFALSYLLASPETVPIEAKLDAILNLTSYSFFLVGSGCSSSYNVEVHRDDVRYAIEITAVALCKGGKLHAIINEETILSLVDDVFGLDFDKHKKSWAEIRTQITQNQEIVKFLQKFINIPYIPDASRLIKLTQEECERAFVNVLIRRNKIPHSDASLDIAEALSIIASRFSESDKMRLSEQDMTLLSKSLRAIASSGRNKIPKATTVWISRSVFRDFSRGALAFLVLCRVCNRNYLCPSMLLTLKALSIVDESDSIATVNSRNVEYWFDVIEKIRFQLGSSMQRGSGQCDDTQSISLGEWMTYVAQIFEKRTGIENSIFKAFKILDKEDCGALPYSEAGTFIRLLLTEQGSDTSTFSAISNLVIEEHINHVASWLIETTDPGRIIGMCTWEKVRENAQGLERNLLLLKTYIARLQQHENVSLLLARNS